MAENLADGEFWLPPQFLSDDDDSTTVPITLKHKQHSFLDNDENTLLFPSELPYGGFSSSDLSSPIDSLANSSETESDEDEQLVAELTRRMARSCLQDDDSKPFDNNNNMGRFKSSSPQSTLCAFGNSCRCGKGSSHGSPNGVCEDSSSKATWDLLHAAAGEVERMRLNQQSYNLHNNTVVPQRTPSPVTLPSKNNTVSTNHEMGFFNQPSISHQQLQIAQFQMLRNQQIAKNQNLMNGGIQKQCGGVFQNRARNCVNVPNNGNLGLSSSAWPTLQHAKNQQIQNQIQNQQYGCGMRAVFLGNSSGRRESTGTGVFLPRPIESRKKPACATALVPARVAQALNLKLDDYVVGCQPQPHLHHFNSTSNVENAGATRLRGNYVLSQTQQRRSSRPQPAGSNEISLPQEWTY